MKTTSTKGVIRTLCNEIKKKKLNLNHPIQRKQDQFSKLQKSLLIDSCLRDYPIPPVYVFEDETGKYIIDGKQRLSSIYQFINDEFSLAKDMKAIPFTITDAETDTEKLVDVDVSEKSFSELPKEMQDQIKDFNIVVYTISDCTNDELNDIFLRLNNGSPLVGSQKLRAVTSMEVKERINTIISSPLFTDVANITGTQIKKSEDEATVLQTLMLLKGEYDFSKNGMMEFAKNYTYAQEDFDTIENASNEIAEKCSGTKLPKLKKVSLPMVIAAFTKCNDDEAKNIYISQVIDFFEKENFEREDEYKALCSNGTASSTKVKARYDTFAKMAM